MHAEYSIAVNMHLPAQMEVMLLTATTARCPEASEGTRTAPSPPGCLAGTVGGRASTLDHPAQARTDAVHAEHRGTLRKHDLHLCGHRHDWLRQLTAGPHKADGED